MSDGTPRVPRAALAVSVLAGAVLAVAYTLSPLTVLTLALVPALLSLAAIGLSHEETRWLWRIVLAGTALRVVTVLAMFLVGDHDSQAATLLTGDEAYALSRTLRVRSILLGVPLLKHDYIIAFEDYGRTSYLSVMTLLQVLAGPSPYGLRLVNMLLFFGACLILFRLARHAYGTLPAFALFTGLVFLPTLFFWSIALLKEALYFALATVVLSGTCVAVRAPHATRRVLAVAIILAALAAMRDLRQGAVFLVGGAAVLGVIAWAATASVRRFAVVAAGVVVAMAVVVSQASVLDRARAALNQAAQMQIGHVFTVGHAYKTLDEGFYVESQPGVVLTDDEAARYVLRSIARFVVTPLPWQMASRSELVFLPEHMLWYVSLPLALIGFVAGLRRDRLFTCLLAAAIVPTALVVALTNGNVGTLIRFRGLVWPYVLTLSALGAFTVLRRLLSHTDTAGDLRRYVSSSLLMHLLDSVARTGGRAARASRILAIASRWFAPAREAPPSLRLRLAACALLVLAGGHLLLVAGAPAASAPAAPAWWWALVMAGALIAIVAAGPIVRARNGRQRAESPGSL